MNYALLLAGGSGRRIKTEAPKQYIKAGGHMMITYALAPLLSCGKIDAVYVAAEHAWRKAIMQDAESAGLDASRIAGYAAPGKDRQGSILNGMREILRSAGVKEDISAMSGEDTVLIHDAARPFLSGKLLDDCYGALPGHDGVMPVLPVKDTVYFSDDGKAVSRLLERQKVYAGQAPELFRLKAYYEANRALLPERLHHVSGSAEPAVMAGLDIAMIPGDEGNFKITTQADLRRFEQMQADK